MSVSNHWLFETAQALACQAPLSMEFSRQEYWSGLPFPPSGDLPNPGIKPMSPGSQADSLPPSHLGSPLIVVHFCFVFIFYWSIVDLQCCANFCCTAVTHLHTNIHFLLILFFHFMVYPRRFGYKSLCYTVGPCCLSILNVTVCIYKPQTPSPPSPSSPSPWQPQDYSATGITF